MKQKNETKLSVNAFISTPEQISEINENLNDVEAALETNATIIKNEVAKQRRLMELKDETLKELRDIPKELLDEENWNELKKSTITEIKEASGHLNKFGRSAIIKSSKAFSEGKDFISENTPKFTKKAKKSLKRLFERKQSFTSKDVELIKQLAELKQQGIISAKEFSEKKKNLLAKL